MRLKVVFIGNSIVAGYPWSKGKSFVGVLRRALKGEILSIQTPEHGDERVTEQIDEHVAGHGDERVTEQGDGHVTRHGDERVTEQVKMPPPAQPKFTKNIGFDIINKGVNGDTAAGIMNRFKTDVLDHNPDIIFIMTGTNDFIYRDATPEEAFANLERMAGQAEDVGATPIYMTPLPVDAGKAEYMWMAGCGISYDAVNRDLDALSGLIRKSGRLFVDTNELFREYAAAIGDVDLVYLDGLHPTPGGHEFIAGEVMKFLNRSVNF